VGVGHQRFSNWPQHMHSLKSLFMAALNAHRTLLTGPSQGSVSPATGLDRHGYSVCFKDGSYCQKANVYRKCRAVPRHPENYS